MNTLISVVIPTYNRKQLVVEAIKSVLQQEPKNYEVIVVDDESTDSTVEYLKSLNLPIQIIQKEHNGISKTRNAGIKEAGGKYIAFLDSDDLWLPGILKEQLEYLELHPDIPLVYTDQYIESFEKRLDKTRFQRTNATEGEKTKFNLPGFVEFTPIHISSVMIKRAIFDEIGYFDEDLQIHEDTEFWNRISEKYNLGFIEKPLAVFRWEKDLEHILKPALRKLFITEGRKYMQIYEQRRKQKGLTKQEKKAIEESHRRIDQLEQLVTIWENKEIKEDQFNQKREQIFK